jgi:hypothetical protein
MAVDSRDLSFATNANAQGMRRRCCEGLALRSKLQGDSSVSRVAPLRSTSSWPNERNEQASCPCHLRWQQAVPWRTGGLTAASISTPSLDSHPGEKRSSSASRVATTKTTPPFLPTLDSPSRVLPESRLTIFLTGLIIFGMCDTAFAPCSPAYLICGKIENSAIPPAVH